MLVVDDEPDNLDAFRFNFRRSFKLLHRRQRRGGAGAGSSEHDVAVIVTDQRMPRMTGLEFLKAAREVRPDAVGIILTAFTDVDVLIEAINLGRIYRYVTKPWDSKELQGHAHAGASSASTCCARTAASPSSSRRTSG